MASETQRPFMDTETADLIREGLSEVLIQIADGKQLRRLQKAVGDRKKKINGIMKELGRREVAAGNIKLPFGATMESLFGDDDEEEATE